MNLRGFMHQELIRGAAKKLPRTPIQEERFDA